MKRLILSVCLALFTTGAFAQSVINPRDPNHAVIASNLTDLAEILGAGLHVTGTVITVHFGDGLHETNSVLSLNIGTGLGFSNGVLFATSAGSTNDLLATLTLGNNGGGLTITNISKLLGVVADPVMGFNLETAEIIDSGDVRSIAWDARQLVDSSNLSAGDWESRVLQDSGELSSVHWEDRILHGGPWEVDTSAVGGDDIVPFSQITNLIATLGGTDTNAVHVNETNEINSLTEMVAILGGSVVMFETPGASFAKRKVVFSNLVASVEAAVEADAAFGELIGKSITVTVGVANAWSDVGSLTIGSTQNIDATTGFLTVQTNFDGFYQIVAVGIVSADSAQWEISVHTNDIDIATGKFNFGFTGGGIDVSAYPTIAKAFTFPPFGIVDLLEGTRVEVRTRSPDTASAVIKFHNLDLSLRKE